MIGMDQIQRHSADVDLAKKCCAMCTPFFLAISTFLAFVAFVAVGANVDCDPTHQPATHSGITNPRRLFVETHLCCRLRVRVRDRLARNLGRSGGLRSSQPLFQKVHQVQVSRPTNVTAPPDLWPYEGKFHKRGAERTWKQTISSECSSPLVSIKSSTGGGQAHTTPTTV